MTHYLNCLVPDIECDRCAGTGEVFADETSGNLIDCPGCDGGGYRPMTPDEIDDAAADAFSDLCEGEPPMSMDEMHRAAWAQKRELRR